MSQTPDPQIDPQVYQRIAQDVQRIITDAVNETMDADLETAIDTLHERLNAVEGMDFNRAWCQQTVEALRRGDAVRIQVD